MLGGRAVVIVVVIMGRHVVVCQNSSSRSSKAAAMKLARETATPPKAWPEKKGVIPTWDSNKPAVERIPAVATAPQVPQRAKLVKVSFRNSSGSMEGMRTNKSVNKKTNR